MTAPKRPQRPARRRPQPIGSWRHFIIACIALVLLIVAIPLITVFQSVNTTLDTIQQDDPRLQHTAQLPTLRPISQIALTPHTTAAAEQPSRTALGTASLALPSTLQRPISILLIGVDKRPSEDSGARSDTLILVRLDPQQHTARMLSIPRDSVVLIPNIGWAKVNAAYASGYASAEQLYGAGTAADAGGAALAAETIEQWLNISIDYTAQIDFHGFERLVDSLGGILIDVPAPLYDSEYPTEDYGYQRIFIPAGLQVMDGRTALIYARTRHSSSDYERSKRQQEVLRSLLSQVRERGLFENVALLPEWAAMLRENVRTTMPISDMSFVQGLAALARNLDKDHIQQLSINPNDVALDSEDGSDLYWNAASLQELVQRWENPSP